MNGLAAGHCEKATVMIPFGPSLTGCPAGQRAPPISRLIARLPIWGSKRGKLPSDRQNQGRYEHETAPHLKQSGPPAELVCHGRASQRLHRRSSLVGSLPNVKWRLGDRSYDADWFRETLQDRGIRTRILGRKQRKTTIRCDKRRYKRRNRSSRDVAVQCTAWL